MEKKNVMDTLRERGFIKQVVFEEDLYKLLGEQSVSFYIGFDPTADSLHVGHFLALMAMAHMQKAGHKPFALVGCGTGKVGDPTGRTDMRQMMTNEVINNNCERFKQQMSKFLSFEGDNGVVMVNNADWLDNLNYIDFLREVGVHFSVNRMLTAECFKTRMEKGLSFLEFNYMIMQAYDFLELNKRYNCVMQLGGNDQWSNIIAGVDLIRRKESKPAYGMTFSLLTNSEGKKMGKTENGAVWLDASKTSPYEFYQYWRNVDDKDVKKCLSLLTFLPMEEVNRLSALEGSEINKAKEVLAFELTKIVHNEQEATKAQQAAKSLFEKGAAGGSVPTTEMSTAEFVDGIDIITLLTTAGIVSSRSEARRLVQQGGIKVADKKITSIEHKVTIADFTNNEVLVKKGKKGFHNIVIF